MKNRAKHIQTDSRERLSVGFCRSYDLDFFVEVFKRFFLSVGGCLVVYVHRGRNIGVSHDLLDYFQIGFVLTEACAEGVPEMMYAEMRKQERRSVFRNRLRDLLFVIITAYIVDRSVDELRTDNSPPLIYEDEPRVFFSVISDDRFGFAAVFHLLL